MLSFVVKFNDQVLFNMLTYRVTPLTCSLLDAAWFLSLPEVYDPAIQTVGYEMQPHQANDLFVFNKETNTVYLNQTTREEFLDGNLCPAQQYVTLAFDLESNVLRPSTQYLEIPIERREYIAFEGFKMTDETTTEQAKELEVEEV